MFLLPWGVLQGGFNNPITSSAGWHPDNTAVLGRLEVKVRFEKWYKTKLQSQCYEHQTTALTQPFPINFDSLCF